MVLNGPLTTEDVDKVLALRAFSGGGGGSGSTGPAGSTGPTGPSGVVGAAGGDLRGTYPNPTVAQITGLGGNVNILANQTTLGSSGVAPVIGGVYTVSNPGVGTNMVPAFTIPASTSINFQVTIQIYDGAGNTFDADYEFYVQRIGAGAAALVGNSFTTPTFSETSGTTPGWGLTVTIGATSVQLGFVGPSVGTAKAVVQVF